MFADLRLTTNSYNRFHLLDDMKNYFASPPELSKLFLDYAVPAGLFLILIEQIQVPWTNQSTAIFRIKLHIDVLKSKFIQNVYTKNANNVLWMK